MAAINEDSIQLAKLGYKQDFKRAFGVFENFAASFSTIAFVIGVPQLFGFAMYTGGPLAAWVNWIIVGLLAFATSLCLAEICSAMPTAGGIYFWASKLGGDKYGPFLSWLTAWWNFCGWVVTSPAVQQGATLFVVSAIKIKYPDYVPEPWHQFLMTCGGLMYGCAINVANEHVLKWFFRLSSVLALAVYVVYFIWLPAKAPSFQNGAFFTTFVNGTGFESNSYCWMISLLFPAYTFYGYDASAHVAEETQNAATTAARGMWGSVFMSLIFSFSLVLIFIFTIQDLDAIVAFEYPQPIVSLFIQTVGEDGAIALCVLIFLVASNCTACCMMSGSRVTYAISRDGVLPGSHYIHKMGDNSMPNRAVYLMTVLGMICALPILGSTVAFTALASTGTIAVDTSYAIPIIGRVFIAGDSFKVGTWNLGAASKPLGMIVILWIGVLFFCLCLPQLSPVTPDNLNYAPVMIAGITLISVVGWYASGKKWFKGPQRLISVEDAEAMERDFNSKMNSTEFIGTKD